MTGLGGKSASALTACGAQGQSRAAAQAFVRAPSVVRVLHDHTAAEATGTLTVALEGVHAACVRVNGGEDEAIADGVVQVVGGTWSVDLAQLGAGVYLLDVVAVGEGYPSVRVTAPPTAAALDGCAPEAWPKKDKPLKEPIEVLEPIELIEPDQEPIELIA